MDYAAPYRSCHTLPLSCSTKSFSSISFFRFFIHNAKSLHTLLFPVGAYNTISYTQVYCQPARHIITTAFSSSPVGHTYLASSSATLGSAKRLARASFFSCSSFESGKPNRAARALLLSSSAGSTTTGAAAKVLAALPAAPFVAAAAPVVTGRPNLSALFFFFSSSEGGMPVYQDTEGKKDRENRSFSLDTNNRSMRRAAAAAKEKMLTESFSSLLLLFFCC